MLTAATLSLGHRSHVMSLTVSRPSDVRNGWKANGSVNESQMVRIDHRQVQICSDKKREMRSHGTVGNGPWWTGLDSNQRTGIPGRFTVCCL
jgi:hypothetical protein